MYEVTGNVSYMRYILFYVPTSYLSLYRLKRETLCVEHPLLGKQLYTNLY
jgi:hypothetical protein